MVKCYPPKDLLSLALASGSSPLYSDWLVLICMRATKTHEVIIQLPYLKIVVAMFFWCI
jgi:hypothetical protein